MEEKYFYEVSVKFTVLDVKGNEKPVTEKYLVVATTFSDAESRLIDKGDVIRIRRTNIYHNLFLDTSEPGFVYIVTLKVIAEDENTGKDITRKYNIAVETFEMEDAKIVAKSCAISELNNIKFRDVESIKRTDIVRII